MEKLDKIVEIKSEDKMNLEIDPTRSFLLNISYWLRNK